MKNRKNTAIFLGTLGAILAIGLGVWFIHGAGGESKPDTQSIGSSLPEDDPFQAADAASGGEEAIPPDSYGSNGISAGVATPGLNGALTYDGTPISIEYEFSCENPCVMGLMIYIDGFLQPYTVSGQETTMHTVNMGADDTQRFTLEFTPVCGRKGEELAVVFTNINNPIVMELSGDINTFGNNQKISQLMPWKLQLNADSPGNAFKVAGAYETKEFSDGDKEKYIEVDRDGNRRNMLDDVCKIEIRDGDTVLGGNASFPKGEPADLDLYIYGNLTGKYRVSLYGDFARIPINGYDYVDIEVKKDAYCVVPFTADFESLKVRNIYAVAAPVELENYLEKSSSVCIAEE